MTGQQQPQAPDNLDALLVVQAAALLTLEAGSAFAATIGLRRALDTFARDANRRWITVNGQPNETLRERDREHLSQALRLELRQVAEATGRDLGPILRQEAEQALEMGAKHAGEQIGLALDAAELALDDEAHRIIDATPQAAISHLLKAAEKIEQAQSSLDVQMAVAEAQRSITSVNTGSTYLTNHVANDAARQVAVRFGEKLLWIAERDACVVCLKLSGELADPNIGEGFDEFATYGPYEPPSVWPFGMPLMRPPRHPHCRCQVCVWLGSAPGQPDLPERLRHEAARSILKGWSLPSESNRVRLVAASRLLASGGRGLPRSVQEEAALAIARGRFKSRAVPHYTPREKHHV